MARYIIKRFLLMIPMLLVIIFLVQLILFSVPGTNGNRLRAIGYEDALDDFFIKHDMKEGFMTKYVRYVYNLIVRREFTMPTAVEQDTLMRNLSVRVTNTIRMSLMGLAATIVFGIPLGILSALNKGSALDRAISALTLFFASIPSYCFTIFLTLLFSLVLRLLPATGSTTPGWWILPTAVLAIGGIALVVRMVRSAVLEVLDQPYITAVRARGIRSSRVIMGHVFRNSLITVVSAFNNVVVQMFCSTIIVENFFAIPGVGAYLISSINRRDIGIIMACVLIIALILMVISILCEILHMLVNPRVRLQLRASSRAGKEQTNG